MEIRDIENPEILFGWLEREFPETSTGLEFIVEHISTNPDAPPPPPNQSFRMEISLFQPKDGFEYRCLFIHAKNMWVVIHNPDYRKNTKQN